MNPLLSNLLQTWSDIYRGAIKNPSGDTRFLTQALESVPPELLDDATLSKLANQLVDSIMRISPQAPRIELNKRFQRAVSEFLLAKETAEELQQNAPSTTPQPPTPPVTPRVATTRAPAASPPPEDWRNLMTRMVESPPAPLKPTPTPAAVSRPAMPETQTQRTPAPTPTPPAHQPPRPQPPTPQPPTPAPPSPPQQVARATVRETPPISSPPPGLQPTPIQPRETQVASVPPWNPVPEKDKPGGPSFSFWDEIADKSEENSNAPTTPQEPSDYIFGTSSTPAEEPVESEPEPLATSPWETQSPTPAQDAVFTIQEPTFAPSPPPTPPTPPNPREAPAIEDDVPTTWSIRQPPQVLEVQNQRRRRRAHKVEPLLNEIVAAAKSQFDVAAERSKSAYSVVTRAKEPILEFGVANLERRARDMLAAEHWDDAAVIAVHLNLRRASPDSTTLACEIGDGLRLAQYDNLAVLCYTSAVVASPPCEPACWRLCEMAIAESDPILGPRWTEFIARILHAQGMDNDAITVYRQLLRLSPQRIDVAQILSAASISNVLPD
jgi:hypothetical protein